MQLQLWLQPTSFFAARQLPPRASEPNAALHPMGLTADTVQFSGDPKRLMDSPTAISHVMLHYAYANRATMQKGYKLDLTYDDLAGRLQDYLRGQAQQFKMAKPEDVEELCQILPHRIFQAFRILKNDNWVKLKTVYSRPPKTNFLEKTWLKPVTKSDLTPLETVVLEHLTKSKYVARHIEQRVLQQRNGYKVGQHPPLSLSINGITYNGNAVNKALRALADDTGMINVGSKQMNASKPFSTVQRFTVVASRPQSTINTPPKINQSGGRLPRLLYGVMSNGGFQPGSPFYDYLKLTDETGLNRHSVITAVGDLKDSGILEQAKGRWSPIKVKRAPDLGEVQAACVASLGTRFERVDRFIDQLTNQNRGRLFMEQSSLGDMLDIDPSVSRASFCRLVSEISNYLMTSPVPILSQVGATAQDTSQTNGNAKQYQLSPNLDFDALKKHMAALKALPLVYLAGASYHIPVWRMPRLYQPQTGVIPTLEITPKSIPSLDYDVTFTLMPDSNVTQPIAFDTTLYKNRCVDLITHCLPLKKFDALRTAAAKQTIDKCELTALLQLQGPLKDMGFEFKLPQGGICEAELENSQLETHTAEGVTTPSKS